MAPSKALIIGTVWPEPTSSAAGVRTIGLIEDLRALGWSVTVASSAKNHSFRDALAATGVAVETIEMNHSSFDELLARERFALCVFDRFLVEEQFGARVASVLPDCIRVLDTIDLHFLRRSRELRLKGKIPHAELDEETCLRELASIYRSDLTLVLSAFELNLLREEFGVSESILAEWGFCYDSPDATRWPALTNRRHLAWIGNFRHAPNEDAAKWIAREVLPSFWREVRASHPDVELHIYGAYPSREIMALDRPKEGVRVLGPCENAIETLSKYRALFSPLRFGAGIKGKVADSWAAGLPVITTAIGAEGMTVPGEPFAGAVVESIDEMKNAVRKVLGDDGYAKDLQERGRRALDELYGREKQRARLSAILERTGGTKRTWVQKILWHQNYRSTDFFSRWIEEKEKKGKP